MQTARKDGLNLIYNYVVIPAVDDIIIFVYVAYCTCTIELPLYQTTSYSPECRRSFHVKRFVDCLIYNCVFLTQFTNFLSLEPNPIPSHM